MDENFGYIQLTVTTANGAVPLQRAIITVKDEQNKIIAVLFTDNNGFSPKLKVLAPKKLIDNKDDTPVFYNYSINVNKDDYMPCKNYIIPVYSEITSIQQIDLLPFKS